MGVFLTLGYALNRIWEAPRDRPLLLQYAIAAGLALSAGLLALLSALLALLRPLAATLTKLGFPDPGVSGLVGLPALVGSQALDLLIVAAAAVLYRALPNATVRWGEALPPAVLTALLWETAKLGFARYLTTFAHVDRLYGPVAAIAGLMLWLFVASILLLFGAELSRQLARARTEGAT